MKGFSGRAFGQARPGSPRKPPAAPTEEQSPPTVQGRPTWACFAGDSECSGGDVTFPEQRMALEQTPETGKLAALWVTGWLPPRKSRDWEPLTRLLCASMRNKSRFWPQIITGNCFTRVDALWGVLTPMGRGWVGIFVVQ